MTQIQKRVVLILMGAAVAGAAILWAVGYFLTSDTFVAGASVHKPPAAKAIVVMSELVVEEDLRQRFQRPSQELPYPNPYSFQPRWETGVSPGEAFPPLKTPEDAILAYFGILQGASNMIGYSGGCGSIGYGSNPYPYAYGLLSKETQGEISLEQFVDSFKGIGFITLLKVFPAYAPWDTPNNIRYYMTELEIITGTEAKTEEDYHQGSLFAYYYGLVTTEKTALEGWKIKSVDLVPEDFLCAPMHNWFYLSDAVIAIVYQQNQGIIDQIDCTEQMDQMTYIYASGNGQQYRFDFVRLTNGYDVLLHENILKNGVWVEADLLPKEQGGYKLSIENPNFSKT